jgi:hypothetical protein
MLIFSCDLALASDNRLGLIATCQRGIFTYRNPSNYPIVFCLFNVLKLDDNKEKSQKYSGKKIFLTHSHWRGMGEVLWKGRAGTSYSALLV